MNDAVLPRIADAWPQVLVLAGSCVAFAWAVAAAVRGHRSGGPLVAERVHGSVPWQAADVALVVCVYLAFASLLGVGQAENRPLLDRLVVNAVLSLGTMLAAFAWLRFRGATWPMLGFPGWDPRDLAIAGRGLALAVFPLLILAAALNALVRYEHPIVDFLGTRRDVTATALVVLSAVVIAPLTEEFFFRRVLQGWLEKHFADEPGVAVALSAIAFAAAHAGQGLAFLPLFPLAVLLGRIAERTGSILPCVILHGLFNAVSVFLLLAQPRPGGAG